MDGQRPISSPVRRQPTHQPRASSAQTLMHGDGGRSSDSAASNALNYGGASPIQRIDRKSTRLNSSHGYISYAVFCLKKKISLILVQSPRFSQVYPLRLRRNLPLSSP